MHTPVITIVTSHERMLESRMGGRRGAGLVTRKGWRDGRPGLADSDLDSGSEPSHRFRWAAVSELASVRFEPAGLVPELQGLGNGVRHILLGRCS